MRKAEDNLFQKGECVKVDGQCYECRCLRPQVRRQTGRGSGPRIMFDFQMRDGHVVTTWGGSSVSLPDRGRASQLRNVLDQSMRLTSLTSQFVTSADHFAFPPILAKAAVLARCVGSRLGRKERGDDAVVVSPLTPRRASVGVPNINCEILAIYQVLQ